MANYTQSERPLEVIAPTLEKDSLLLRKFEGRERISHPFQFNLEMLGEIHSEIRFEKLLGHGLTIRLELANHTNRFFHGIVKRLAQSELHKSTRFRRYRAEVVPAFWLLRKQVRSRIFQRMPVPEILRQVLTGFDVSFAITGTYPSRDYVVQYGESDFHFASRLMEEEGIWYFFEHKQGNHRMVVTDRRKDPVEGQSSILYNNPVNEELKIWDWEKAQEIGSGKVTLWDYHFEMPSKNLETSSTIAETIQAGSVVHSLRIGGNQSLEIYEYPGGYAQRFDGIDRNGNPHEEGIRDIFHERDRSIQLRIHEQETQCLDIEGKSNCGNFSAGHTFGLKRHFDGDGDYLLTDVLHRAELFSHDTGDDQDSYDYSNHFHCLPAVVNFRPARVTPKPVMRGVQTATVVGPAGEEIFVDPFGRVKVQFHWDREGQRDMNSSCWIRVSQFWAGNRWGAFFWPRIGHEVVVAFEDGDPDNPLVTGSVYNADNMPYFELPFCKDFAGIKSSSISGNAHEHYNGIVMVDRTGQEHLSIHSERHLVFNAEFDRQFHAGRHQGERIPGAHTVTVGGLPFGGGSGGGPSDAWAAPTSARTNGLSAKVVYGTSFGASMPLSFNTAMFSNMGITMNPIALRNLFGATTPLGPLSAAAFGALGKLGMALGTDTDILIGQRTTFHVAPTISSYGASSFSALGLPVKVLAGLIVAANITFQFVYWQLFHDDDRAFYVAKIHTPLTQTLFLSLLIAQSYAAAAAEVTTGATKIAYGTRSDSLKQDVLLALAFAFVAAGAIGGPLIADSIAEKSLEQTQPTPPDHQTVVPGV